MQRTRVRQALPGLSSPKAPREKSLHAAHGSENLPLDQAAGHFRPRIVKIMVSYAWDRGAKSARSDRTWRGLREILNSFCDQAQKRAEKIDPYFAGAFRVERLRATHGMDVWHCLARCIREADIYIADVASADGT